jgi:TfoX/Sxy family transcriptional regulator of competence genes
MPDGADVYKPKILTEKQKRATFNYWQFASKTLQDAKQCQSQTKPQNPQAQGRNPLHPWRR